MNETETETEGQAAPPGQHGRGATPGERRGGLVGATRGPVPVGRGGRRSTTCKFVLAGLADHAELDSTRQSCYAAGLHPAQRS